MTKVIGQIDSLRRLKAELKERDIVRFNSVGEIKFFLKNYNFERQKIFSQAEQDLDAEIDTLKADSIKFQENYDTQKIEETQKLNKRIDNLGKKTDLIKSKNSKTITKAFDKLQLAIIKFRRAYLKKKFDRIIIKKTFLAFQKVNNTNYKIVEYSTYREKIISDRSLPHITELANTKEVLDDLYPLIAGAIGENLVVKELKNLSDNYVLINDFYVEFETPIYNRKNGDKIFSIQIDHLLITDSGIFIIETKNWSKDSIENLDLRSPINQIKRSNYALFVILNGVSKHSKIKLDRHHWGEKQVPIRSLIAMINHKPKEKFKFVAVKTLKELNRYITYFDPIFDDSEVKVLSEYLETMKQKMYF